MNFYSVDPVEITVEDGDQIDVFYMEIRPGKPTVYMIYGLPGNQVRIDISEEKWNYIVESVEYAKKLDKIIEGEA